MIQIMILILIAAFAIIAYILGWMNAIRACEEEVLCSRQELLNFSNAFDNYTLNEAIILKQIKFILMEDFNQVKKDQLLVLLSKRINSIEEAYTKKQASLKEMENFEDACHEK